MDTDNLYQQVKIDVTQLGNKNTLATILNQIERYPEFNAKKAQWYVLAGDLFRKNNELEKALKYYRKSYKINTINTDSLALILDQVKIGIIYHRKLNNSFDNNERAKVITFKDSATYYYKKNIEGFKSIKNNTSLLAYSYSNLSYLYADDKQYNKAQSHITKAIALHKKLKDTFAVATAMNNQALLYIHQKKYQLAIKIHKEIIKIPLDTTNIKVLGNRLTAFRNLEYTYAKIHEYKKAHWYGKKSYNTYVQIHEKKEAAEVIATEAKYNIDKIKKKEAINIQKEVLKTEAEIQRRKKTQLWLWITGLTLLCLLLAGIVFYRNNKLKQQKLALELAQKEVELQKKIQKTQNQNQNQVLNATLDGREKERNHIALTLHDSVSALLSSVSLHLQVIKMKSSEDISEIAKSQRIINEASDKVRDLSHGLISAVLLKFGLKLAIEDLCEKYSNQQFHLTLHSEHRIPRFEKNFEIKIHRIIEECINNIMKHSKASEASINLSLNNNTLDITINDNGIGFDTLKINPNAGIGLSLVISRVDNMNGFFDIQSKKNKGTKITIQVPVVNIV